MIAVVGAVAHPGWAATAPVLARVRADGRVDLIVRRQSLAPGDAVVVLAPAVGQPPAA